MRSRTGWQVWATERLMDDARTLLFPLYASLVTPVWLRALGARVGRDVEASTVLMLPRMTTVGDGAFLADDTMVGSYELGRGWMRIERAKVGKRAFLGNSGMTAPGRAVPKRGLVAVLSATPERAKAGSSWLGCPPVPLRRAASVADEARTFAPPRRLRGGPRRGRGPAAGAGHLHRRARRRRAAGARGVPAAVGRAGRGRCSPGRWCCSPGWSRALVTTAAKWAARRPDRGSSSTRCGAPSSGATSWPTRSSRWSPPRGSRAVRGRDTPRLVLWLRALGAHGSGRGVWCETYWLPEADLVTLGDGATRQPGVRAADPPVP